MARSVIVFILCTAMVASASLALAGGPAYPKAPYGKPYGPPPANCAYWGDAPFPGMCGGVVALPFLVLGSLLGGNPIGPSGPAPAQPPYYPPYKAGPCGPAGYAGYQNGSMLAGLPCFELCSSLLGAATGGTGLLY